VEKDDSWMLQLDGGWAGENEGVEELIEGESALPKDNI